MASWEDLSPMDQVSFWIGRVSRADTAVEKELHHAWEALAGHSEGLQWAAVPRLTSQKIGGIRAMLKEASFPEGQIRACLAALKKIEDSHVRRNGLVHGNWSQGVEGQFDRRPSGRRGPEVSVTWDIQQFEALWLELAHRAHMAGAVYTRAMAWSSQFRMGEWWELKNQEELAGRFELSGIDDSGPSFSTHIRFTGDGVEERMRELDRLTEF